MIAVTKLIVNSPEAAASVGGGEEDCHAYDRPVSTVGQRIEEIQRRLGGISANELGRRCNIPGQTLTNIVRTCETNPAYMPRAATLNRLVEGTGVSLLWLEHGLGSPDDPPGAGAGATAEAPLPPGEAASAEVLALERELFQTMNRKRYLPEDFDETRKALRAHFFLLRSAPAPLAIAQTWLEAVFQLRTHNMPINASTIPARASIDATLVPPERPDVEGEPSKAIPESVFRAKVSAAGG